MQWFSDGADTKQTSPRKAAPHPMRWLSIPATNLLSRFGALVPIRLTQWQPKPRHWPTLVYSLRWTITTGQWTVDISNRMSRDPSKSWRLLPQNTKPPKSRKDNTYFSHGKCAYGLIVLLTWTTFHSFSRPSSVRSPFVQNYSHNGLVQPSMPHYVDRLMYLLSTVCFYSSQTHYHIHGDLHLYHSTLSNFEESGQMAMSDIAPQLNFAPVIHKFDAFKRGMTEIARLIMSPRKLWRGFIFPWIKARKLMPSI